MRWVALLAIACGSSGSSPSGRRDAAVDALGRGVDQACLCGAPHFCGGPCQCGNSLGVGHTCTRGGGECRTLAAIFCTVDAAPGSPPFCTLPCDDDSQCGENARCAQNGGSGPSGCVPIECLGREPDAGADARPTPTDAGRD